MIPKTQIGQIPKITCYRKIPGLLYSVFFLFSFNSFSDDVEKMHQLIKWILCIIDNPRNGRPHLLTFLFFCLNTFDNLATGHKMVLRLWVKDQQFVVFVYYIIKELLSEKREDIL